MHFVPGYDPALPRDEIRLAAEALLKLAPMGLEPPLIFAPFQPVPFYSTSAIDLWTLLCFMAPARCSFHSWDFFLLSLSEKL
jgi:hypothetical protein